ncbi:amino acid permease [Thalassotalea crassostreae]|uniref:amino acid permease n=1 Tax=Thalassotalea crassostreae TaxID=1763536 RepID=UPI000838A5A8|nr:amino acid permease [Thalassotalea crassostreae]
MSKNSEFISNTSNNAKTRASKIAKKPLGLLAATSLVTGNMIGSGIFLLPASLALYGGVSLWGWAVSAIGAIALAYMFANLAGKIKGSGGPYIYSQAMFGDFIGFLVAWGYWICVFTANAAIAIALVSYLSVFIPMLSESNVLAATVTIGFVWFLVLINLQGVKAAGNVQVVSTLLKVIPMFIIVIVALFYINVSHFTPFNLSAESDLSAISSTAVLTLWAFLGMESANNAAGEVDEPETNVPKAAVYGTLIAASLYIPGTIAIFGLIEPSVLAQSNAPFADAAAILWGDWAYYAVAAVAVISCFGALNGWTLCVGQIAMSASKGGLFPKVFSERSKNGVPAKGVVISSFLVSVLVLMNFNQKMTEQFTFIILLSTLASVFPYLICSFANIKLLKIQAVKISVIDMVVAFIATVYSSWIILNMGAETLFWGTTLMLIGIPLYAYEKRKTKNEKRKMRANSAAKL